MQEHRNGPARGSSPGPAKQRFVRPPSGWVSCCRRLRTTCSRLLMTVPRSHRPGRLSHERSEGRGGTAGPRARAPWGDHLASREPAMDARRPAARGGSAPRGAVRVRHVDRGARPLTRGARHPRRRNAGIDPAVSRAPPMSPAKALIQAALRAGQAARAPWERTSRPRRPPEHPLLTCSYKLQPAGTILSTARNAVIRAWLRSVARWTRHRLNESLPGPWS